MKTPVTNNQQLLEAVQVATSFYEGERRRTSDRVQKNVSQLRRLEAELKEGLL